MKESDAFDRWKAFLAEFDIQFEEKNFKARDYLSIETADREDWIDVVFMKSGEFERVKSNRYMKQNGEGVVIKRTENPDPEPPPEADHQIPKRKKFSAPPVQKKKQEDPDKEIKTELSTLFFKSLNGEQL